MAGVSRSLLLARKHLAEQNVVADDYTNDDPCLETPLRREKIISVDNSDCPDLTASIVERARGVEEGGEEVKEEGVPPPTKPKSDPICKNIYLLLT